MTLSSHLVPVALALFLGLEGGGRSRLLLLIWAPGWSRPGRLSAQRPFQPCHKRVGPGSSHGQAVPAAFPSPDTERTVFTPLGHIPTALGWVPTCSQVKKGLGRGRGGRGCGPEPQHLTEAGPDPPALLTLRGPAFMALCPPHGGGSLAPGVLSWADERHLWSSRV